VRLAKLRIRNYRSIKDTGWFEVEPEKTILVGPNEAGKTAVLRAAEHLEPGPLVKPFDALRDYPRSEYHDLQMKKTDPDTVIIAEGVFSLDNDDLAAVAAIHPGFSSCSYALDAKLSGNRTHRLVGAPERPTFKSVKDQFRRLALHADGRVPAPEGETTPSPKPTDQLTQLLGSDGSYISGAQAAGLGGWLDDVAPYIDEADAKEMGRLGSLREIVELVEARDSVLDLLGERTSRLVYFSTYTRVRPLLHLGHLADAIDGGAIDPADPYHFGNYCLLKLLGFSARELSDLGACPKRSVRRV
jgi:AAA ATPase-like protein